MSERPTASMRGLVTDTEGTSLPDAAITAIDEPTGTTHRTSTRGDGMWTIRDLRVGGPYRVTADMAGFGSQTKDRLFLTEGEDLPLEFRLATASIED